MPAELYAVLSAHTLRPLSLLAFLICFTAAIIVSVREMRALIKSQSQKSCGYFGKTHSKIRNWLPGCLYTPATTTAVLGSPAQRDVIRPLYCALVGPHLGVLRPAPESPAQGERPLEGGSRGGPQK